MTILCARVQQLIALAIHQQVLMFSHLRVCLSSCALSYTRALHVESLPNQPTQESSAGAPIISHTRLFRQGPLF